MSLVIPVAHMRLDWNDIKARAEIFADSWRDAQYERGQTQSFYNDFFELFGVSRRRVAVYEHSVKLIGNKRGFLDLFWKGKLLVEQKSAGRDLKAARTQALEYFPGLKEYELPRYILLSDFQTFELYDLDIDPDTPLKFQLSDLPQHVQAFGFIVGQERRIFRDQDPVNILASEMMGNLHDALDASGYRGYALERFLVRLLFCLFGDDTGIFQPLGVFEDFIRERTHEDGRDVGARLIELFQTLNTPEDQRSKHLDAELAKFPYINGDLFNEALHIPAFNRDMREKLLNVCGFQWETISPAIFGSLFQSVLNKADRRKKGAHYTSEKNILKVVEPLFMDDLRKDFTKLKARRDNGRNKALLEFQTRIAGLTFFDPACGCGNFLVIAYRELRELELEVLKEIYTDGQLVTDIGLITKVNVDQYYGIEISEFPARIAEVAMWMMDHIMNVKLSGAFGKSYQRIPLITSPNIRHGDALEIEWAQVLDPTKCSYVFGNPPFIGQSYQSPLQRKQMAEIIDAKSGKAGSLDYVCAWFLKAAKYAQDTPIRIAFVSTNSITQGEQVAQLWPMIFGRYGLEIAFAHRTFEWESDAKGKAHVHCVIIGLTTRACEPAEKRLFSYPTLRAEPEESQHVAISPYLFDAGNLSNRHLIVQDRLKPLTQRPKMMNGPKSTDGGHLLVRDQEITEEISKYLRPYIGSVEFINSIQRSIFFLGDVNPAELSKLSVIKDILVKVREFRKSSQKPATRKLSDFPTLLEGRNIPEGKFLVVPQVSSERRDYIPIGWMNSPSIPSDKLRFIEKCDDTTFALLTSKMHMAWMRAITGRMKSDYMYSVGIVYNNFPLPDIDTRAKTRVEKLAQAVLDARAVHEGATLADLYDPDVMPPNLRKAHKALDAAVDALYRKAPFASDRERVEHLFMLYEKLTADLVSKAAEPLKKMRKKRVAKETG